MLAPGFRLGPYEILAPLGAGGMGEVYRAKDTRLGRDVAVKVLPEHLSADPDVRARFEREAKTVSSLNHPNICTLFDVGSERDTEYLVMELIEGETLAARLRRGPMSGPELLRLGTQIADALDRAHRAGVIHRDLKPGNVMLTRSGAKLMDFGLARAADVAKRPGSGTSGSAMTQSPTVGQALTAEGTIVGTFQYMAPEQLEGHEADARSDVWALGCVLYEMASGKRAFEGRSQATLIAAIIGSQPAPIAESPSGAPPTADLPPAGLDRLIRACLAKDPEDRVQTAHAVKQQLEWIAEGAGISSLGVAAPSHTVSGAAPGPVTVARPGRGPAIPWLVTALAVAVAAGAVAWLWPRAHAPKLHYRFRTEPIPGAADYFWPRVSPDGRWMVVDAQDSTGRLSAWLRPLDQTLARLIPGSEGLRRAYWSPDSREIAFVASEKIQRLAITGGAPVVVCESKGGADLSWGSAGFILMDGRFTDSLQVVPARGGELKPASRIYHEDGEIGSAWPCFLPDGKRFLFIGNTTNGGGGGNIRLGRLGSLDSKLLGRSDGRVEYAPGDWVVYLKGTTLLARKLDAGAGKLVGQPLTIAENVRTGSSSGHFSVSRTGVLAYARGGEVPELSLVEMDRDGRPAGAALASGLFANPAIAPDGGRLLYEKRDDAASDPQVNVRDLRRGTETKLTLGGAGARLPDWSPDGRRFACVLDRAGASAVLLVASSDGFGARDTIPLHSGGNWMLDQWSAALGRLVATPPDFRGVWSADPDSGGVPARTEPGLDALMGHLAVSPDGRWLAFVSNESGGSPQMYVQSLAGAPGRWQISTSMGIWPRWTKAGREIVYEAEGQLMVVDIDTREGFHPGTPRPLFGLPMGGRADTRYWTCTPDGERFFVLQPPRVASFGSIEVVTDFASLVNRR